VKRNILAIPPNGFLVAAAVQVRRGSSARARLRNHRRRRARGVPVFEVDSAWPKLPASYHIPAQRTPSYDQRPLQRLSSV
jgi:hypothetical protein